MYLQPLLKYSCLCLIYIFYIDCINQIQFDKFANLIFKNALILVNDLYTCIIVSFKIWIINYIFRCVDDAVKFPGLETFPTSSYAVKQIISREIDLEKLRKRTHLAGLNYVTEEVNQFDDNEKNISTPKSSKG